MPLVPLFEYRCEDCEAVLEVFQQPGDPSPRLCGYRCALGADDERAELRGFGALARKLSAPGLNVRSVLTDDRPTAAEIERSGFTVYRNEGGKLVKSQGDKGPDEVKGEG
ncbi:MAG: zinc ribbon domain-containing protein [Alphaproteobacteria bacterium]|nr:zinc ribbon domain-containing protein [Alphaproteobacteria bacterium]